MEISARHGVCVSELLVWSSQPISPCSSTYTALIGKLLLDSGVKSHVMRIIRQKSQPLHGCPGCRRILKTCGSEPEENNPMAGPGSVPISRLCVRRKRTRPAGRIVSPRTADLAPHHLPGIDRRSRWLTYSPSFSRSAGSPNFRPGAGRIDGAQQAREDRAGACFHEIRIRPTRAISRMASIQRTGLGTCW